MNGTDKYLRHLKEHSSASTAGKGYLLRQEEGDKGGPGMVTKRSKVIGMEKVMCVGVDKNQVGEQEK